jgi:lysophospholipase L1-like esterase
MQDTDKIKKPRILIRKELGGSLIFIGILLNKWVLEQFLSKDNSIESLQLNILILLFQLLLVVGGTLILVKKPIIYLPNVREVLIMACSTLVVLLFLEMSVRAWINYFADEDDYLRFSLYQDIPQAKKKYSPHHYLNYVTTPGYQNGNTSHNSLGYRGKEFRVKKEKNIFRIVALGGSTINTSAVEDNENTFPSLLEKVLQQDYNYDKVEVINAGVSGYSSWETLISFQFRVLELDPNMIIVYHGTNDVHPRLVREGHYRGDNSGRRKQWDPPAISLLEHSALTRFIKRKLNFVTATKLGHFVNGASYLGAGSAQWQNSTEIAMKLLIQHPPEFFKRNLSSIAAIAKAHGVKVLFSTWAFSPEFSDYASTPAYIEGFKESNLVVVEVAAKMKLNLYDFAAYMPSDKKYWADGRHVNEEGAALKAKAFAEYIYHSKMID